VIKNDKQNVT